MKSIKIAFGIFIVYLGILFVGQCIPNEWIMENVSDSYEVLSQQGLYGEIVNGVCWDNWTESYFINVAATEYKGNILQRMIANAYTVLPGYEYEPLVCLNHAMKTHEGVTDQVAYSRYWAGATVLVKALHVVTDINGIRSLVFMIVLTLLGMTCITLNEALGKKACVAFGLSVFASMYIPNSLCLTFSFDVIIMLAVINICWKKIKRKDDYKSYVVMFGVIGSICAYVGYWAFPLITLGMPLVFLTMLRLKADIDEREVIRENLICSVVWTMGIVITVVIKQALAQLLLGEQTGSSEMAMWIGTDKELGKRIISVINGIMSEIRHMEVIFVFFVAFIMICIMWKKRTLRLSKRVLPYLLIALYPVAWWFIFYVHSGHSFVRYMYGVAYFAIFSYFLVECYDETKIENVDNKK